MDSSVTFVSKQGNRYLYSPKVNRFLFLHPLLNFLLDLHSRGQDIAAWINNMKSREKVEIKGSGTFSKKELLYYYKKFLLLSENQFLEPVDNTEKLSGRISKEQIYSSLADVKDVVFEVTDNCNLECTYCGYGDLYENYDSRVNKNLAPELAITLLNYLHKLWNSPLSTSYNSGVAIGFYGGEPLLNMHFIKEIVSYCLALDDHRGLFSFGMTTNGLLVKKYMDYLVKHDFKLLISLDGDEQGNRYRVFPDGNPSFETVFKNAKLLRDTHPAYFKDKVNFNVVLHNKNSMPVIYDFFKNNFDKIPFFGNLNITGIKPEKLKEFREMHKNRKDIQNETAGQRHMEDDVFIGLPHIQDLHNTLRNRCGYTFTNYNDLKPLKAPRTYIPTGTCLPFSRKIYLASTGKIFPCERIGHQYALGRVDKKGVHIDAEHIARRMNAYFDKLRKLCVSCQANDSCGRCVFHLGIEKDSPQCIEYMSVGQFREYLAEQISTLEDRPEYYSRMLEKTLTV